MPPKPQTKPRSTKPVSSTSKAVDDFLAQTTVPAGMLERQENEKKQKEKIEELKEKFLNLQATPSIQLNFDALNRCRVISNIFSGIASGILGNGLGAGILFWLALNFAVSVLIYIRVLAMGLEKDGSSCYFHNLGQAAFSGLASNIMTYLLFWIMFYNIVYVV